jgi:hypothetical protein
MTMPKKWLFAACAPARCGRAIAPTINRFPAFYAGIRNDRLDN